MLLFICIKINMIVSMGVCVCVGANFSHLEFFSIFCKLGEKYS